MLTEKIKLENEYQSIVNEIIATEDNKRIKELHSELIDIQIEISKIEGGI